MNQKVHLYLFVNNDIKEKILEYKIFLEKNKKELISSDEIISQKNKGYNFSVDTKQVSIYKPNCISTDEDVEIIETQKEKLYPEYDVENGKYYSKHVADITRIENGRVIGNLLFATQNGELISDISCLNDPCVQGSFTKDMFFNKFDTVPRPQRFNGKGLYFSFMYPYTYYHSVFDVFSMSTVINLSDYDFIYCPVDKHFPYLMQYLKLLEIKEEQIVPMNHLCHLEFSELTIVRHPFLFALKEFSNNIKNCINPTKYSTPEYEKIYISRKDARTWRNCANEDELYGYLESKGFKKMVLSELSAIEQIELFNNASFVVGIIGSGHANSIYCRPGTKFIELCNKEYFFCNMQRLLPEYNFKWGYMICDIDTSRIDFLPWYTENHRAQCGDLYVDLKKFDRLYKIMLNEQV